MEAVKPDMSVVIPPPMPRTKTFLSAPAISIAVIISSTVSKVFLSSVASSSVLPRSLSPNSTAMEQAKEDPLPKTLPHANLYMNRLHTRGLRGRTEAAVRYKIPYSGIRQSMGLAAAKVEPQKAECCFEDFEKMDIRTATVLEAERVPKTDKLLKLTIDTGIDTRTIVSGIAEYYSPEEMVGKQICILANLAPRKIRGIESKGMILMARQGDGKMRFVTPAETLNNGAQIG